MIIFIMKNIYKYFNKYKKTFFFKYNILNIIFKKY